jgi:hypothetical protein
VFPNALTFPTGGSDTSALNPLRFHAPWNDAVNASVGAPLPTEEAGVTVTTAEALRLVSATLVAVTVTRVTAARNPGAVYSPAWSIVPTTGLIAHVTAVFERLLTVAVNCWRCEVVTDAVVGEIETLGTFNCTRPAAVTLVSNVLVAVNVMVWVAVIGFGAVYCSVFPLMMTLPTCGLNVHVTEV